MPSANTASKMTVKAISDVFMTADNDTRSDVAAGGGF